MKIQICEDIFIKFQLIQNIITKSLLNQSVIDVDNNDDEILLRLKIKKYYQKKHIKI